MKNIYILTFILLFFAVSAYSMDDSGILESLKSSRQAQVIEEHNGFFYVKAFYNMGENDTMANTRERLKQKAFQMVSEYKGGEYTSSKVIIKNSGDDSGGNLSYFDSASLSTLGFIEKVELLKEEPSANKLTAYYKLHYHVLQGNKPDFGFSADMKERRLRPGERIMLEYSIQTNAWIYFFNIYMDSAALLFPNSHNGSNFINAGKYSFPSNADIKKGIHFDASLPEGKSESMEMIRAIVASRPMNFDMVKTPEDILTILFQLKREEFEIIDIGFSIQE